MAKLNVKIVQSIAKEKKPGRYADGQGLYLMMPRIGEPYWMLRYTFNAKRREMTIGKQLHLSLADARIQAENIRIKIRQKEDPISERKKQDSMMINTINDLFFDWHNDLIQRLKFPQVPFRIFTKDIAPQIGQSHVSAVTPLEIRAIIKQISNSGRPSVANDALMYLKQLFNHGIKLGLLVYNPAAAFNINDAGGLEKSRDRVLTFDELTKIFQKFRERKISFNRDNYLACALLVTLGVRKTELTQAKWIEFNLEAKLWNFPEERSKTNVGLTIPLPTQTITWLQELKIRACGSDYVFPSRRASKNEHMSNDTLNRAISKLFGREPGRKIQPPNYMGDLVHFTVHDLRRTCRSLLASQGVPGHVAERCLNHKLKGVEGVYDRYDYFEEREKALNKLADLVAPIVDIVS